MATRVLLTHGHSVDVNMTIKEVEARLLEANQNKKHAMFDSCQHKDISNTKARFDANAVVALIEI